jgi:hypothetical protein
MWNDQVDCPHSIHTLIPSLPLHTCLSLYGLLGKDSQTALELHHDYGSTYLVLVHG